MTSSANSIATVISHPNSRSDGGLETTVTTIPQASTIEVRIVPDRSGRSHFMIALLRAAIADRLVKDIGKPRSGREAVQVRVSSVRSPSCFDQSVTGDEGACGREPEAKVAQHDCDLMEHPRFSGRSFPEGATQLRIIHHESSPHCHRNSGVSCIQHRRRFCRRARLDDVEDV